MGAQPKHARHGVAPALLIALGALGFLGIAAGIASDVFGAMIRRGYDVLSETITLLAHRRPGGSQDIGLYLLGAGALACGAGLALMMWTGFRRRAVVVLILACGLDVFVLTAFDLLIGYFPRALLIHELATGLLFVMLIATAFLFASAVRRTTPLYARWARAAGVAMVVLAPTYFLVPPDWTGLVERLLAIAGLTLLALFSCILVRRDWRVRGENAPVGNRTR